MRQHSCDLSCRKYPDLLTYLPAYHLTNTVSSNPAYSLQEEVFLQTSGIDGKYTSLRRFFNQPDINNPKAKMGLRNLFYASFRCRKIRWIQRWNYFSNQSPTKTGGDIAKKTWRKRRSGKIKSRMLRNSSYIQRSPRPRWQKCVGSQVCRCEKFCQLPWAESELKRRFLRYPSHNLQEKVLVQTMQPMESIRSEFLRFGDLNPAHSLSKTSDDGTPKTHETFRVP